MRGAGWWAAVLVVGTPAAGWAYGEPDAAGLPNPQERLTHVFTNQIRQAPHDWPGWDTAKATPEARRPLVMIPALYTAARFHSDDMAAQGCFQHESCDGTPFGARMERYFQGPVGENIYTARGISGAEHALTGWMNSDGHRTNILRGQWDALGTGFTDAGQVYYVQDFGVAGAPIPPIPAAAYDLTPAGALRLIANYYDPRSRAPAALDAVLSGTRVPLAQVSGPAGNQTLAATTAVPTGCAPLYFVARDADGKETAFPTVGALLVGPTCTEGYTATRSGGPSGGDDNIIDANDPGGCRCAQPGGGAGWLALLALALPGLRRRRSAHQR
jgi:MYXO-CTERM domain-containing protein